VGLGRRESGCPFFRRGAECRAAPTTELLTGFIGELAGGASSRERRSAFTAETPTPTVLSLAAGTLHALASPRGWPRLVPRPSQSSKSLDRPLLGTFRTSRLWFRYPPLLGVPNPANSDRLDELPRLWRHIDAVSLHFGQRAGESDHAILDAGTLIDQHESLTSKVAEPSTPHHRCFERPQ